MSRPPPRSHAARFLGWLGATTVAGTLAAIAAVVLVDPYRLYGFVEVPGFNAVKPRASRYQNEIKVTQAARSGAEVLIVGNSRAEIGFDPLSPALARAGLRAYNIAVPGSSIRTARQQLAYLYGRGAQPKSIIVGVEFLDYLGSAPAAKQAGNPPLVLRAHPVERWAWRVDTLFSLQSLVDAAQTLRIQHDPDAEVTSRPCKTAGTRMDASFPG